LIPDRGAAGAAAALSIGHSAILVAIAVTAYVYRNATPRGPRELAESEAVSPV
jgi:hypothetical protein